MTEFTAVGKKAPHIVVIGGANMDIGGKPDHPLREKDSNPGHVRTSVGGVGRNIAHNLRLLDLPVTFLTALGKDAYGDRVVAECAMAGIDCERVLRTHEEPTSTYLYIADEAGDMRLAISDMEICRLISPAYLAGQRDLLDTADALVLDANIPEESIRYLTETCSVPVFADPVSVSKAGKLQCSLSRIHTLKPNRLEAELLSGISIRTDADLPRVVDALLASGLKQVFLSLGADGVYAAEAGRKILVPCCPASPKDMTGAGDAMLAGLVWSYLHGKDLSSSARLAAAAAAIAVEGAHTVNPVLSPSSMLKRAGINI